MTDGVQRVNSEDAGAFILRRRVERDYTVLPNTVLRDMRLTFKARGLLVYLLHLPADWRANLRHLSSLGPDGRTAIASAVDELREIGYLAISRPRDAQGLYVTTEWTVTDSPSCDPRSGFPNVDNPNADYPNTENLPLLSTNTQQELKKLKTTTTRSPINPKPPKVVVDEFESLKFPAIVFSRELVASAKQTLRGCPAEHRQGVLDEVAGIFTKGKLRGSPIGLLARLSERARDGKFVPSAALSFRANQQREAAAQSLVESQRSAKQQATSPEAQAAARAGLAKMRETLAKPSQRPQRAKGKSA